MKVAIRKTAGLALALGGLLLAASLPALAEPYFVPARGQSKEQLNLDIDECRNLARTESGADQAMVVQQPQVPPPAPRKQPPTVRGPTARGAATGAVVGAIAGDTGKGAAIGAGAGATRGVVRRSRVSRQQAQPKPVLVPPTQRPSLDTYNQVFRECMQSKGYVEK